MKSANNKLCNELHIQATIPSAEGHGGVDEKLPAHLYSKEREVERTDGNVSIGTFNINGTQQHPMTHVFNLFDGITDSWEAVLMVATEYHVLINKAIDIVPFGER